MLSPGEKCMSRPPRWTVKAPSTHSKVSVARCEWAVTAPPGASVISATTRVPPLSSDVSRKVMVSLVPGLLTVRDASIMVHLNRNLLVVATSGSH